MGRARALLTLFGEMALLSASVLGGGYVILSEADRRLSKRRGWIREGELFEALPLFQMVPGIIGGHTAVYVGDRVAGALGSAVALAGMVLPSVAVFLAVSLAYRSLPLDAPLVRAVFLGLRAALTGILAEIVVRTWRKSVVGVYGYAAVAVATAAIVLDLTSPGRAIVAGMVCGVALALVRRSRARGASPESPRVFRSFWAIPLLFVGYGLMAFGGGYVLVPAYLRDFVGAAAPCLNLSAGDFANVMALTEMTPGPVSINCATFFGYELGGVAGSLVATAALVLPGSAILWFALRSVDRFRSNPVVGGLLDGVRPVAMAMIVSACWAFAGMSVWNAGASGRTFSPLAAVLAAGTFAAVRTRRVGAVPVILLSALAAVLCGFVAPVP